MFHVTCCFLHGILHWVGMKQFEFRHATLEIRHKHLERFCRRGAVVVVALKMVLVDYNNYISACIHTQSKLWLGRKQVQLTQEKSHLKRRVGESNWWNIMQALLCAFKYFLAPLCLIWLRWILKFYSQQEPPPSTKYVLLRWCC